MSACQTLPYLSASRYSLVSSGGRDAALLWSIRAADRKRQALDTDQADETALVALVAKGDAQAYRTLSERHLGKIVGYANRLLNDSSEAEDVAQETFLRLWQQAERWQPKAKLHTWLFRVAHNQCIDRLRKRRETGPDALERFSSGDRPSGLLSQKQLADQVTQALAELPERQQAAIVLTHYQGLSNPDAAAVLECGVEALESLLSRARRTLRKELSYLQERLNEGAP